MENSLYAAFAAVSQKKADVMEHREAFTTSAYSSTGSPAQPGLPFI